MLGSYFIAVRAWSIEPLPTEPLTDDDIEALFPPGHVLGSYTTTNDWQQQRRRQSGLIGWLPRCAPRYFLPFDPRCTDARPQPGSDAALLPHLDEVSQ